jgi:hypothetical protein
MNMIRETMLREAIAKVQEAGLGINVDEVRKVLPDDFGLDMAELVCVSQLPITELEPPQSEPITPHTVADLREFIRLAATERAEKQAELKILSNVVRTKRGALAQALQTFVNGMPRRTDHDLRVEYMRSEQEKRVAAAEGRLPVSDSERPPRALIDRIAWSQKFGINGKGQGDFRRGFGGQRAYPAGMRGARIATDPATGRKSIVR